LFILDKCITASREDFKQDVFQGRARPSLGVVHRYIKYNLKKKEATRAAGPLCSPYLPLPLGPTHSFMVGFYPRHWVLPLRPWVLPFVLGSYPSSLGPTIRRWALPFVVGPYHSSLGPTIHRWAFVVVFYALRSWVYPFGLVLPFAVGFYPLRAAGAITFVWLDTRAAGAITFMWLDTRAAGVITCVWFGMKAAGAKGGGCERRQVRKAAGLNTLVLFNMKAVSCWSVRRRQFDLLAWVSSSSCHRRGSSLVVTGPYSLSSGRRLSFGLRSPLVPLMVAAPHPHGRWVFVSLAGHCWFSG